MSGKQPSTGGVETCSCLGSERGEGSRVVQKTLGRDELYFVGLWTLAQYAVHLFSFCDNTPRNRSFFDPELGHQIHILPTLMTDLSFLCFLFLPSSNLFCWQNRKYIKKFVWASDSEEQSWGARDGVKLLVESQDRIGKPRTRDGAHACAICCKAIVLGHGDLILTTLFSPDELSQTTHL